MALQSGYVKGAWFRGNEDIFHGLLFHEEGSPKMMKHGNDRLTLDLLLEGKELLCTAKLNGNGAEIVDILQREMQNPKPTITVYGKYYSEGPRPEEPGYSDRKEYVELHAVEIAGYHVRIQ
jgi:hypothetical protein